MRWVSSSFLFARTERDVVEQGSGVQDKRFERRVALVTAIIAVAMAIAALGGSNSTKEMLLAQQQASDQWAFYQAKVIRENLYRTQAEQMRATLLVHGKSLSPEATKILDETQAKFEAEAARYAQEKKEVEAEAKTLEARRDVAGARDQNFDYAGVLFQVAIVLGSVAILSESRNVLVACLLFGAAPTFFAANGFLLFWKLPF
jgi:hypothetical protein